MDFGESDEDELPTHLDSTLGSIKVDANDTESTFQSSHLTDRTVSFVDPPSPGTARKRVNDEIYEQSQRPLPSTTPLKTPPKLSFQDRVSTGQRASFSRTPNAAFKDVRPVHSVAMSTQTETKTPASQDQDHASASSSATFVQNVAAYQKQLEDEFQDYENELKGRDRSQELATLDWEDLEDRYQKEIGPKIADEQQIMEEFQARFNQFMLWMHVSGGRESERAIKRLRTRVSFVQNSESQLEKRQEHYGKVLAAFHNAMDLLGTT